MRYADLQTGRGDARGGLTRQIASGFFTNSAEDDPVKEIEKEHNNWKGILKRGKNQFKSKDREPPTGNKGEEGGKERKKVSCLR